MSHAVRHRWLCIGIVSGCILALTACDLDAVPRDPTRDFDRSDDAGGDVTAPVCVPGETRCLGPLPRVERCSEDGTQYLEEECEAGTYCSDGECKRHATQCDESDDSLPLSVSATELTFDVSDDLKSTTTSLDIENCSDAEILLNRTEIRESPSAGRAVFSVVNAGDFQELRIPPGVRETIKVTYEPRFAFSREPGLLRLQFIGGENHEFDIPLRPRTYCVSATPKIDTGLIQGTERGSVFLQNCGSEPVHLESISTVPNKDDSQPQATITVEKTSGFEPLEAGKYLEVPYQISGGRRGLFNHRIVYHMDDASKFAEERIATEVTGRVASLDCRSSQLPPPLVEPGDNSEASWEASANVGEQVEISMRLPDSETRSLDQLTPIFRYRPPSGSRSVWEEFDSTFPALGKNWFTPDIPGTYRVDLNYIDEQGRPLCEWKTVRVHVRPRTELYVDLDWKTHGDLISEDVGYGRGADLNLHILPFSLDDPQPAWGDIRGDCFGYGEYAGEGESSNFERSRCELFDGFVQSTSVSGAHREAVGFSELNHDRYYIAIHAWTLSGFPAAVGELRIFYGQQQVDDYVLREDDDATSDPPGELSDLLNRRLQNSNDAWILGYWDTASETLVVDRRRHEGLPH